METKLFISSLLFSLYFQGLELFFTITGLIGFKPTWLTALYQVGLLFLFFCTILFIPQSLKKLGHFSLIDIAYVIFFTLVLIDFLIANKTIISNLPEHIFLKFTIYSLGLFLARGLTLKHFKMIFYITTVIAVISSLLLVLQLITDSANFVNNGTRLANGLSDNPINTGYIGAYTFLNCIILTIKHNKIRDKNLLIAGSITGLYVTFATGTRSAFVFIFFGVIVIIYSTFLVNLKSKQKPILSISNTFLLYCCLGILGAVFYSFYVHFFSSNAIINYANNFANYERIWTRISQIFLIGTGEVTDHSILSRYDSFNYAWQHFLKNPLMGGGFYISGYTHNAFLQSLGDFGLLGLLSFTIPFFYFVYLWLSQVMLNITNTKKYFGSDNWMLDMFAGIVLVESSCMWSFHGDPYQSYIPLCGVGILIAYSKLNHFTANK